MADYALALGRALGDRGTAVQYVVSDHVTQTAPACPCTVLPVSRDLSVLSDLLTRTAASTVVAHYVGHGYARRGCPTWLVRGLARWRRGGERRLITIFHEVYAFDAPWTSSFWLSPFQRFLASQLARVSDGLITSLQRYAGFLLRLAGRPVDLVLPVVSTVGEPISVPPLHERSPHMIVFGSPHHRRRVYVDLQSWLRKACEQLAIEEILDVGEEVAGIPQFLDSRPVRRLGKLPAASVQEILLSSIACFIGYHPDFLPKSTVYAAACAHGVLPVCATTVTHSSEGLQEGRNYWLPRGRKFALADAQAIARTARSWYLGHDTGTQADALRRLF